jgi:hypothetical protein
MSEENKTIIKSEKLAYWYFRLNGFLTIPNLVIHPDQGTEQRTEVDILGVRFPYRAELLENSMPDDEIFIKIKNKPYIVIAEVKSQTCNLNRYWRNPEKKDLNRIISCTGAFINEDNDKVAQELYGNGNYQNDYYYVSLFCLGKQINRELQKSHPNIPQVTWEKVLRFIYSRFKNYEPQKSRHPQWEDEGQKLWRVSSKSEDENEFISKISVL